MHRYLLRFYKKWNMRFISHLDLSRLFKRIIRRSELDIAFSNGFNPHELINIVQPLSLGYEGESEYFEIDTNTEYSPETLLDSLNISLPEGIRFTECKEIPRGSRNMSNRCEYALYRAVLPCCAEINLDSISDFLQQDQITITKKDKKTGKPAERNIKSFLLQMTDPVYEDGKLILDMTLRCASNETLNPGKLLESLISFTGAKISIEYIKVIRRDILGKSDSGELRSIYEIA